MPKRRSRWDSEIASAGWRKLRQEYQDYLDSGGTFTCWKCGKIIRGGDLWVLGHHVPRSRGGTAADGVSPECKTCSDKESGLLGQQTHRIRKNRVPNEIQWLRQQP